MLEMNEKYMKKRKKYGVLFHYHYAKNKFFWIWGSCILHGTWIVHAIDLDGWHNEQAGTTRRILSDETTFYEVDNIYAKKILSLIERVGIIIMWLCQERRRFIRWQHENSSQIAGTVQIPTVRCTHGTTHRVDVHVERQIYIKQGKIQRHGKHHVCLRWVIQLIRE